MPTRLVKDVIRGRAFPAISPNTTAVEAARAMKRCGSSAVLIIGRGKLAGICTERDIVFRVIAEGKDPRRIKAETIMTRDPQVVGPDQPFGHALHLMYEGGFRHVPVVEGGGRATGLLCAADALQSDSRELEEDLVQREDISAALG